jgi:lipopolysaccharide/colanic/teichoic acid biosynthesis glycosyltransferase
MMKRNISSGCQVSSVVLLLVLTMEYGLFAVDRSFSTDGLLYWTGYLLLTYCITCNNHGRNVHLHYERELSLLLKCFVADVIAGIYLAAYKCGGDVMTDSVLEIADSWQMNYLIMMIAHQVSILGLCILWNKVIYPGKKGGVLYIYERQFPQEAEAYDTVIHVDEALAHMEKTFRPHDRIYIHDVSAVKRNDVLKYCFAEGKDVYLSAKLSDVQLRSSYLTQDGDRALFYCPRPGLSARAAFVKRMMDIIFSAIGIVVLVPVFLLIAIAIKLEDGGRVFFLQERCTKGLRRFWIIKFRSMVDGTEESLVPRITDYNDPRITKVGRVIRKCKLDELPQLFNILKGDMSFVGPRPERPELIEETIKRVPEFAFRTMVKAGLTGYAQVHGGYHTDFLDKLKWDLMYINNYSLLLDFKIILMTIPVVIHGSDDV